MLCGAASANTLRRSYKMGELFRSILPETALPWTGERMVPGQTGAIEAEHFHRYFVARELCRGKDVLDVACGEGYGSAFLAQTARGVVGVELDPITVDHATREYRSANLRYVQGEATKLPIDDNSVDAVVSFETIEHITDHETFLEEVKRVLRPDGFLIISTPDMNVYSAPGTTSNPYHVREMTEAEFRAKLSAAFRTVSLVRQRAITGSAILPDAIDPQTPEMRIYEQRDSNAFESDRKLLRAPFLLAVASDRGVPPIGVSLYIQTVNVTDVASELKTELERLRGIEQAVREQAPVLAKAANDTAALQAELERLRNVEAATREQAPIFAKAVSDAASIPVLQAELDRLQIIERVVRDQNRSLTEDRDRAQNEIAALQRQLNAAALLVRQQAAASQGFQRELLSVREEADKFKSELLVAREESKSELLLARQETDEFKSAYRQAASLIIPLRIRQALPEPVKRSLRILKRAFRSS